MSRIQQAELETQGIDNPPSSTLANLASMLISMLSRAYPFGADTDGTSTPESEGSKHQREQGEAASANSKKTDRQVQEDFEKAKKTDEKAAKQRLTKTN